LFKRLAD